MSRTMKDSGIEWIGEIPENWKIVRNKNVFSCSKNVVGNAYKTTQLLSLTKKGIKEKDINDTSGKIPESYETYQFVKPKQIVMCLFDLDCSAVFSGISKYFGMISPAYDVLDCKNTSFPPYYDYWFSFVSEDRKFKHYAKNLRYTLNYNEFACLPVILPPLCEQEKIATFLDDKCGTIDEIIFKTEKSVEEYKKLKEAVITKAVTKGIRSNRSMKDSNIEWIGEIPTDWQLRKLANIFHTVTDYVASGSFGDLAKNVKYLDSPDYAQLIRTTDVSGKGFSQKPVYIDEASYNYLKNSNLFGGEIILPNIGASVGDVYIVPKLYKRMSLAPNSVMLKTNQNMKYFYYFFASKSGREALLSIAESTAQPKFNKTELRQLKVPLPTEQEQKEIAEYLDEKCVEIDTLIEKKQQFLTELVNYKKSLIYEYVTGKKEVA